MTFDVKWVLYDNRKHSAQWLKHSGKRVIHQTKLRMSVWWYSPGMIHNAFMKPGLSIIAQVHCNQLSQSWSKGRPCTPKITVAEMQEVKAYLHPPYSKDPALTEYHFFRKLDNFLAEQKLILLKGLSGVYWFSRRDLSAEDWFIYRYNSKCALIKWADILYKNNIHILCIKSISKICLAFAVFDTRRYR